jgi:hypothetical protein
LIYDVNKSKKTKRLHGFQNQGKNPQTQETLVFKQPSVRVGGKPTKNQGENQGTRKPCFFGFQGQLFTIG